MKEFLIFGTQTFAIRFRHSKFVVVMQSGANMWRVVQRLVALMKRPRSVKEDYRLRHQAWDRDCRARGMTAREQADELQVRCAWVRLRTKASAAALRRPACYLEILDRIARDEARTLAAIGGEELARVFRRTFEATEPLEILSPEAAAAVLAHAEKNPAIIASAPLLVPNLPAPGSRRAAAGSRTRARSRTAIS